jgi:acyl carrier protein
VQAWKGSEIVSAESPGATRGERAGADVPPAQAPAPGPASPRAALIESWLVERLSRILKVNAADLDVHKPFASYGLDSANAVSLSGDLSTWLGRPLSPTLAWDYPTVHSLASHLAGEEAETAGPPGEFGRGVDDAPIAVIGMALRFPGAKSPEEFWDLLRNGVDAIKEVPADRWNIDDLFDPSPATPGKMVTRWGGFIEDVDKFDPDFFGISPREATRIDPQHRFVLKIVWEALENAGVVPEQLAGTRTGVFIGISANDYSRYQQGDLSKIDAYTGTGNAFCIAANRISYTLDLRGPSAAIDTACSSSLMTVHLAVQSLRRGESTLALAGGVNLILSWIMLCVMVTLSMPSSGALR